MAVRKLSRYNQKRDFKKTAEPAGKVGKSKSGFGYLIQKHAASHLHYDFRLELDGVLKSWAVTKGPSVDPRDRRLAVEVEDHPVAYGSFEGIIPKGQYGGGTVMLWDEGTWEPLGDPKKDLQKGSLHFRLHGKRLKGEWTLVRMKDRSQDRNRHHWLLIKRTDAFARPGEGDAFLEKHKTSVVSRRSMERIARDADCAWRGKGKSVAADEVVITHPDKILFPDKGYTKQEVADYYRQVADWILPAIANRPLSLVRCPSGSGKPCFFQRHAGKGSSPYIYPLKIGSKASREPYLMIKDIHGLIALVQMGVLEVHHWGSHADTWDRPDMIVFDFDPDPTVPFARVKQAAVEIRDRLKRKKLKSFLKTTGGKGLHVVVPLAARQDWKTVKDFVREMAEEMAADSPKLYTTNMRKGERKGRIFIDYLRNDETATSIAPYSTRARKGAPVAVPLDWAELPKLKAGNIWNIKTLPKRLAGLHRDPWEGVYALKQTLPV